MQTPGNATQPTSLLNPDEFSSAIPLESKAEFGTETTFEDRLPTSPYLTGYGSR